MPDKPNPYAGQTCTVCFVNEASTECPDCALIMCQECLEKHECDE